jgi:hypothetical protein
VLEGWQDVCYQPDSMTWLRHRAANLAPAEKPAPSFAVASMSQLCPQAVRRARRPIAKPSMRRQPSPFSP